MLIYYIYRCFPLHLLIDFCDWVVFTLSGEEQLGVQHPAKCYSSSPIFRPTFIVA